jgi:uncharacterized integral membrane protein
MPDTTDTNERAVPWRLIAMLVALGILIWFGLANSQRVRVHYLVTTRASRLIYVIAVSAVLGVIIGWFGARSRYRK